MSLTSHLRAQCGAWQPQTGMDFAVYALEVYNNELIAAGRFQTSNGTVLNNIGRWNGSSWQPLGNGIEVEFESGAVNALTVSNGELIAGGTFVGAGGQPANHIARWNGSTWQPLGSGMNNTVSALTVIGPLLFAGGTFTTAGGLHADYIAVWDGAYWYPLGVGGTNSYIFALQAYAGSLVAGGYFTTAGGQSASYIAWHNGFAWSPMGSGMGSNGYVFALTEYNSDLIAGGFFTSAGGQSANRIARWDGASWHPLGTGIGGLPNSSVNALTVYNGKLIAGGYFTTAGGLDANRIAQWDGSSWTPFGTGVGGAFPPDYPPGVLALHAFNEDVMVGGFFTIAGGQSADHVARWRDCPSNAQVNDICANTLPISEGQTAFSTVDATADGSFIGCDNDTCCSHDIWYDYYAFSSGTLEVDLCESGFDTMLAVYETCECPATSANLLACNDDYYYCFLHSKVSLAVVQDHCYKIRIGGGEGSGLVNVAFFPTPTNDFCADAIAVADGTTSFSTVSALTDESDPALCGVPGDEGPSNDIWFNYVATQDAMIRFETCGSSFDTKIALYDGCTCPVNDANLLTCNDDYCGYQSALFAEVTSGNCYKIRVGGFLGDTGTGILTIAPACNDCPGSAQIETEACGAETNAGCYMLVGASGNCCQAHPGPGCQDPSCQAEVCALDPYCCQVEWDDHCAFGTGIMPSCNCNIPPTETISCGQSVCGSLHSSGSSYDIDWYQFTVDQDGTIVTWSVKSVVPISIRIWDANCYAPIPSVYGPPCPLSATTTLSAGTYFAEVISLYSPVLACDDPTRKYVATLTCVLPCPPSPCPRDALIESEGECGTNGNSGCLLGLNPPDGNCCQAHAGTGCQSAACQAAICSFDPFCCTTDWDQQCANEAIFNLCQCDQVTVSEQIECGQTICGHLENTSEDWFSFTVDEPSGTVATWTVVPVSEAAPGLTLELFTGCSQSQMLGRAEEASCPTTLTMTLDPGTYYAHLSTTQVGSCGKYAATLNCAPPAIPGDINGDAHVNVVDLLLVISAWGQCPAPPTICPADLNGNGIVSVVDLLMVISNWG